MGNKDNERFKNFIFFNVYATDEEMEEAMPVVGIVVAIIIIVGILVWIFS